MTTAALNTEFQIKSGTVKHKENWLDVCTQRLAINRSMSKWRTSVPQGSLL